MGIIEWTSNLLRDKTRRLIGRPHLPDLHRFSVPSALMFFLLLPSVPSYCLILRMYMKPSAAVLFQGDKPHIEGQFAFDRHATDIYISF